MLPHASRECLVKLGSFGWIYSLLLQGETVIPATQQHESRQYRLTFTALQGIKAEPWPPL
jgi:hypothetical protein